MILGHRHIIKSLAGTELKDPFLEFTQIEDLLQYMDKLHENIFCVSPIRGNIKRVRHPYIEIRGIIENPYTEDWEYEFYKFKPNCRCDSVEWNLNYSDFVDFIKRCIEDNKKNFKGLTTYIIIRESLFNTFAYEKFEC